MATPTWSEMQQAVFTQPAFNPDDLVECPFVQGHIMKRKKLPYHIPDCRAANGRGFLACSYSQQHFFRTKDELKHHEVICPMRRQLEGHTRSAPSSLRSGSLNELNVNPMVKMLLQRRRQRIEFETAEDVAAKKEELRRRSGTKEEVGFRSGGKRDVWVGAVSDWMYGGTEVQVKDRLFHLRLHQTVLYSKFREEPLLSAVESSHRIISDLDSVVEEAEDGVAAETEMTWTEAAAVEARKERQFEDECRKGRSKKLRMQMANVGLPYNNRFEDDRDASDNPKDFVVDWGSYPNRYRAALKAKFERDRKMYETGKNPRYRKALDHPHAGRNVRSNCLEFEEQAAWYEDVVWKPVVEQVAPPPPSVGKEQEGSSKGMVVTRLVLKVPPADRETSSSSEVSPNDRLPLRRNTSQKDDVGMVC